MTVILQKKMNRKSSADKMNLVRQRIFTYAGIRKSKPLGLLQKKHPSVDGKSLKTRNAGSSKKRLYAVRFGKEIEHSIDGKSCGFQLNSRIFIVVRAIKYYYV